MATATLSIKTDPATKALIKRAADNVGLSLNAFVLMTAKNAAKSAQIVIDNDMEDDEHYLQLIEEAEANNTKHPATQSWEELKTDYGL
ncbi:MAG: DUF1778 domain-containing protein [Propionibacteriaceae bacterium]|nr:DUF1778 domain-containing protein [Propionibacteriaceae bacterium]